MGVTSPRVAVISERRWRRPAWGWPSSSSLPDVVGHGVVEAGEDDGAAREGGDDAHEGGDGGDAGRRAGDEDAAGGWGGGPGFGLAFEEAEGAVGAVGQVVVGEPDGPVLGDEGEEADGLLPVLGVAGFGGFGEFVGERDAGAVGLVEEVGEFAGEAPGAVGVDGGAVAAAQREDEAGEDGETLDGVHRGGEVEGAGQGERGLVEGADGENAGEQEGAASGDAEEGLSPNERAARRVGRRMRPSAMARGSFWRLAPSIHHWARMSRKGRPGAMERMFMAGEDPHPGPLPAGEGEQSWRCGCRWGRRRG